MPEMADLRIAQAHCRAEYTRQAEIFRRSIERISALLDDCRTLQAEIGRCRRESPYRRAMRLRGGSDADWPADAVVIETINGTVTFWNRAAQAIFGYTAAEMIGSHLARILPSECLTQETDLLARLRRGERIENYETTRRTKEGRIVNVSITLTPIKDKCERTVSVCETLRVVNRDLSTLIRTKIAAGVLPQDRPVGVWTAPGKGNVCDACGSVSVDSDIEYQADMPDGRTFRFHQPCLTLWYEERSTVLAPMAIAS